MATSSQYGSFVPNTFVWDLQELQKVQSIDPKLRELLIRLYQNLNLVVLNLNIKDVGQYPRMEVVNGQLWFPNPANNSTTVATAQERQVLRKVLLFVGGLPNNGSQTIPHGITVTKNTSWTRIYATATTATGTGISLPNASTTITTTTSNVVISTTANLSSYVLTYIILEYIQT